MLDFLEPVMKNLSQSRSRVAAMYQTVLSVPVALLGLALLAGTVPRACADTTITSGSTFTIDESNTTKAGTTTTWNDTGTLTIHGGGTLQSWPLNHNTVVNNDAIVFAGSGGTIALKFNGNDNDFMMNGAITSTATGPQTLDISTGHNGNGDRESVSFNTGIPDVGDGSPMSLTVTFRSQTPSTSFVNLPAINTFTGPITLVRGGGPPVGTLTIGGALTRHGGKAAGAGTLGGGTYPGTITLGTGTILNYASSAAQTLSGVISGAGAVHVTGTGTLTLSGGNSYTGGTTVGSGGTLTLDSAGGLTFVITDAATNNRVTGAGTATINGTFTLDTSAVTVTSGVWTLVNTATTSFGSSFSVSGFEDADLDNVWTRFDGARIWTFSEASGELRLAPAAEFASFGLPDNPAIIDHAAKTIQLFVPVGTDLAAVAPSFTVTSGACNQTSGAPPSPTFAVKNPATYTLTEKGTDPDTVNSYTVSVQTYESWAHSGSFFVLTTPEGANLPAEATEKNFPLLLRLNATTFNFAEAAADGRDIRFLSGGASLPYQIEHWDAVNGSASIWLKMPRITGNSRQEITMYWGKPDAPSRSSGVDVFNAANGYVCVFHLDDTLADEVGTLTPTPANGGPAPAGGIIGNGRTFTAGQGVNCGDNLTSLPSGNTSHSTQVWFRSDSANFDIVDWAREDAGNKVQIRLASPPKVVIDGNFANVGGTSTLTPGQWHHVVHTYAAGTPGTARIYVDGLLDGSAGVTMNITPPSIMRLGGWYNGYRFVGDMDEVRLSKVVRSADWIKLEYENQKLQQTLVGNLVQPGSTFSAAPATLTIDENAVATLTAKAGGAQKVYWVEKKGGVDTVLASDTFALPVTAGRVTGDKSYVIQLKGIYPTETKTVDIPVTITEKIPDPVFTLVPSTTSWDGRTPMTVTATITNLAAMQKAGFGTLTYKWAVSGVAVIKQTSDGKLTLNRSQGSGPMTVGLTIDNGGAPVTATKTITVQEPASDPWVERTPGKDEKPVNGQFFARDPNTGLGTIFYNGTESGTPDTVFLKVYKTPDGGAETLETTRRQALVGGAYAFTAPIAAGLNTYRVVYGTTTGGVDSDVATVTDLVCGDAFIIEGQSNALATDNAAPNDTTTTNKWVRTYGLTSGWGYAISKGNDLQLGLWGWYLANRLVANHRMPICIINGAVGGTRIDQHRPNPADHGLPGEGNVHAIYANLFNRVTKAKLNHGIRGLFWHQGEQNQGSGGIDSDYDYKFYQQYFVDISAAWKQDFPNLRNYCLFQIWPAACGDTSRNDQLREVQRTLSRLYSNMKIMSTHGIVPGSGCHYVPEGYQRFSDLIGPLVEQDVYGVNSAAKLTAPNLRQAYFTSAAKNEIALVFDQDVAWNPGALKMLFLADAAGAACGSVTSGAASGNTITLQVSDAATAAAITYLKGLVAWQQADILSGTNGIAALTFADVPIAGRAGR